MRYLPDREPGDWLKIVWHETIPEKPTHLQTNTTSQSQKKHTHHLPTDPDAQDRLMELLGDVVNHLVAEAQTGNLPAGCRKRRK